jgi:hypothetical protein
MIIIDLSQVEEGVPDVPHDHRQDRRLLQHGRQSHQAQLVPLLFTHTKSKQHIINLSLVSLVPSQICLSLCYVFYVLYGLFTILRKLRTTTEQIRVL